MNLIEIALQSGAHQGFSPAQTAGTRLGAQPWFAAFGLLHLALAIVFVGAIVYAAWKLGSYYDAAKKKL